MASLADIQPPRRRPPRIVLYGQAGTGKSTFAAGAPNPFFLPIKGEDGIDDLRANLGFDAAPLILSYPDLIEWLATIHADDHAYRTLVIDSVSTLEPLVWEEVCRQEGKAHIGDVGGGYFKGQREYAPKLWRELLAWLDAIRNDRDMAIVLIGHAKVKKDVRTPDVDVHDEYVWDIDEAADQLITRWCDVRLFALSETMVRKEQVGGTAREPKTRNRAVINPASGNALVLCTQRTGAWLAKGRGDYGHVPARVAMSWDAWMDEVRAVRDSNGNTTTTNDEGAV